MRFSWVILGLAVLMSGCSQKGAFGLFHIDQAHEKSLEQLRSGTILSSLETRAIISTLYLNRVDPTTYHSGEYFLVSLYLNTDDHMVKKRTFEEYGYTLLLNQYAPKSIERLDEKDLRRYLMPTQEKWNQYYLIRFDSVPVADSLTLRLENNQIGWVELNYPKSNQ